MSDLSWIIPYQTAKDFAGPAATVIASIAAAYITWTLASRQAAIAEQQAAIARQQAETALDQLRHNLFEKRYAIYVSAQNLARMLLNRAHEVEISPSEIASYYVSIDEARFFFPDYICRWLDDLKAEAVSVHACGLRRSSTLRSCSWCGGSKTCRAYLRLSSSFHNSRADHATPDATLEPHQTGRNRRFAFAALMAWGS